ncbi:alpha/beta fold hydrolase [Yinghuangia sp. YIM S09857]|uniref:alpha/beta fold hydrolase n=1 Tax=Yinghuangia sp. YIM S09857 TaxID=3436929 RepID=UPI003F53DFBD
MTADFQTAEPHDEPSGPAGPAADGTAADRSAADPPDFDVRLATAYDAVMRRWPLPVETVVLDSEFGTTHVNICGPAAAPPLVLLHGGGTTAAVWYANAADLARAHRVHAIDRIGEPGRSRRGPRPPRGADDLYTWLDGVLDGLGIARAAICGHSYGAWLALRYALHAPRRVTGLVLLDPTQCFGGFRPGYLAHALPSLLRPNAGRARRFITWETSGAVAAEPDGATADWMQLHGLAAEFPGAATIVGRRPKPAELRALASVPTRVILAADSRTHDPAKIAAAARRDVPHAEVSVLPGVSHHAMPWHRAPELNAELTRFLDTLPTA